LMVRSSFTRNDRDFQDVSGFDGAELIHSK
jgi:hypothetical protein